MCWYVMAQMLSGIGCMGSDICACLASYLLLVGERSAATLSTGASEIASRSVSSLSLRTCRVGHAHGHVNPFTRAGWTDRRPRGPGACAFLHLAEQGPFALLTAPGLPNGDPMLECCRTMAISLAVIFQGVPDRSTAQLLPTLHPETRAAAADSPSGRAQKSARKTKKTVPERHGLPIPL